MDLLSHIFLPLILLVAIGRLRANYIPLAFLAILPDFDKLFLVGILHSVIVTVPIFAAFFYLEKRIKHGYEISLVSSYFFFSHLFLDFLDGFVPLFYPVSKIGVGIVFPAKLLIGKSSVTVEDISPQLVFSELKPSNCYDLFSGFGFASMILFFLIIAFRRRG
ncbi:MAG: hypothetical protein HA489_06830 [Archaeoglobales archaeon]|nr:hypothetical protein [Archaeoglobales archaeon]